MSSAYLPTIIGILTLGLLVIAVYLFSILIDRLDQRFSVVYLVDNRENTGVADEAGLSNITQTERITIIKEILKRKLYGGNETNVPDNKVEEVVISEQNPSSYEGSPKNEDIGNSNDVKNNGSIFDGLFSFFGNVMAESNASSNRSKGQGNNEFDHKSSCVICMESYENSDTVIFSEKCTHIFHEDCLLQWLENHDDCPYCRINLYTPDEMKSAAQKVLNRGGTEEV
mmetsp:Transcript_17255/g.24384  ORF Transcript_17255/g.24384 Transcript_17255/m.24384 type:complete len:227 (-) Transcript_17255:605-1285(-)|eukprot:CAMPEP_0184868984 /NCGR_PEP_ID=MMETSP0580-20130426/32419_1 /TAXON_ID=1118495 /ORGANISM="Dactyliosolen fragilissimus" /LENGTH=226 /DNA_ID=CAMNT_0027370185 /DNA_START=58 /DNA_END=738 /DNA_ORIENTATION=-